MKNKMQGMISGQQNLKSNPSPRELSQSEGLPAPSSSECSILPAVGYRTDFGKLDSRSISFIWPHVGQQVLPHAQLILNALVDHLEASVQKGLISKEKQLELFADIKAVADEELKKGKIKCSSEFIEWMKKYNKLYSKTSNRLCHFFRNTSLCFFEASYRPDICIQYIHLAIRCLKAGLTLPCRTDNKLLRVDAECLVGDQNSSVLQELSDLELERWLNTYTFPAHSLMGSASDPVPIADHPYSLQLYAEIFKQVKHPYICGEISHEVALARWSSSQMFLVWLNDTIDTVIFSGNCCLNPASLPANLETLPVSENKMPVIDTKELRIGEEFEFWPNQQRERLEISERLKKLDEFIECIKGILNKQNILYEIKSVENDRTVIQIGDWSCKIFLDLGAIEVNTTPYTDGQIFHITKNGYTRCLTSYECFDSFIHSAARALGSVGRSGHKHVDVYKAFHGNAELMFRVMVDMENATWMPKALDREGRSGCFLYASGTKKIFLSAIAERINQRMQDPESQLVHGSFSHLQNLKSMLSCLDMVYTNSPCNFMHIETSIISHSATVTDDPTTTIEFRLFHCPRSGEESRVINKLLTGRFKYLLECQKQCKPIEYSGLSLDHYDEQGAADAALRFCTEAGLTVEETKSIIRIPV